VIIFLYDKKYIIPNQHDFSIDIAKEFHPNITNTDKLDVVSFGHNPWDGIPLADWFSVFRRDVAILSNDGGMRLPHQFAVYTVLRLLQPKIVIESGVWNGVVTKVIRKTLPKLSRYQLILLVGPKNKLQTIMRLFVEKNSKISNI
jgi:hypothetical protein